MRLLLFGPNGQVGWELRRALAPLGELIALHGAGTDRPADFRAPEQLADTVRAWRPDVIVNAAAYTAVDRAESEPAVAHAVNAEAPGVLAREAAARGAWLVHYGSDYVFDGSGALPRDEAAPAAPLSVYGRSKLAGEEAIRASGCRHLILRTSWVYAARGGNFLRTMLRLAAERERLRVVADQIGAPTGAELLADVTAHALRRLEREPGLGGTYHVAAAGATSWHAYAQHLIGRGRAAGMALRAVPEAVEAIGSADYPTPARRPLNSRLDCRRFQTAFELVLPPWQAGVERVVDELAGG